VTVTVPVCVVGPRTSHPGTEVIQFPIQAEVEAGPSVIVGRATVGLALIGLVVGFVLVVLCLDASILFQIEM